MLLICKFANRKGLLAYLSASQFFFYSKSVRSEHVFLGLQVIFQDSVLVCCYYGVLVCCYYGVLVCYYYGVLVCCYYCVLVCCYYGVLVCCYYGVLVCCY